MTSTIFDIILTAVLTGIIPATIAITTAVQSRRANREQKTMITAEAHAQTATADAEVFTRAQGLYEGVLAALEGSNERLLAEILAVKQSNESLRAEIIRLQALLASLKP